MRASNVLVVNSATPAYGRSYDSNCGEISTDVYAPGASTLSTVSTQNNKTANRNRTYFGSLDGSAAYYDTTFETTPALYAQDSAPVMTGRRSGRVQVVVIGEYRRHIPPACMARGGSGSCGSDRGRIQTQKKVKTDIHYRG